MTAPSCADMSAKTRLSYYKRAKLSPAELEQLRYAARNRGRNYTTSFDADPTNAVIKGLMRRGLFRDDGEYDAGRWVLLTEAGASVVNLFSGRIKRKNRCSF